MASSNNPFSAPVPPVDLAEPAPPPPRDPVWTFWDVLMIAVVFMAAMIIAGLAIVLALRGFGITVPKQMSPMLVWVMLGAQSLAYIVVLFFMYHLITSHYGRDFSQAVRFTAPTAGAWFYYLLGGVALAFLVGLIGRVLPIPQHLPIDKYFQNRATAWLLSIFGVSLAPLVEELFFRGFFYPVVARGMGVGVGAVLTAASFALMHANQLAGAWGPLLILFVVGMALTLTRIVTRSVVPGFLIHVGYNATLFTLLYLASSGFRHLDKVLQQ